MSGHLWERRDGADSDILKEEKIKAAYERQLKEEKEEEEAQKEDD